MPFPCPGCSLLPIHYSLFTIAHYINRNQQKPHKMKFELNTQYSNIPDEDLINDVIAVSKITGKDTVTAREYVQYGAYCKTTLLRHFNSWATVMKMAGLKTPRILMGEGAEELLFKNLAEV